jgi:hypothetical protein
MSSVVIKLPSDESRNKTVLNLQLFHLCSCLLTLHADHTISISAILPARILPFMPTSGNRSRVNFKAAFRTLQL